MVEVHPMTKIKKWFSLNRLGILHEHYLAIKGEARPKGAKEKEEFHFFTTEFERYYRKAEHLAYWRIIMYILAYATIAVSILQLIPFLSFLAAFIELGGAYLGGVAIIIAFVLTVKINMHIQRMQACLMHLVAFYHANPKRDTARALKTMSKAI